MPIDNPWLIQLDDRHRHNQPWTLYDMDQGEITCRVCGEVLRRTGQFHAEAAVVL